MLATKSGEDVKARWRAAADKHAAEADLFRKAYIVSVRVSPQPSLDWEFIQPAVANWSKSRNRDRLRWCVETLGRPAGRSGDRRRPAARRSRTSCVRADAGRRRQSPVPATGRPASPGQAVSVGGRTSAAGSRRDPVRHAEHGTRARLPLLRQRGRPASGTTPRRDVGHAGASAGRRHAGTSLRTILHQTTLPRLD